MLGHSRARSRLPRKAAGRPEKQPRGSAPARRQHSAACPAYSGPSLGAEMPATRSSSSARRRSTKALSPPASPGGANVPASALSALDAPGSAAAVAPVAARAQAHESEGPTAFVVLTTYFAYAMLVLMGHIRDFLGRLAGSRYRVLNGVKVSVWRARHWPPPARLRESPDCADSNASELASARGNGTTLWQRARPPVRQQFALGLLRSEEVPAMPWRSASAPMALSSPVKIASLRFPLLAWKRRCWACQSGQVVRLSSRGSDN